MILNFVSTAEPEPPALGSHHTLSMKIEVELRHRLMIGALRPNDRITIAELATNFGTSPTPVREALLRLSAVGAIEFRRSTSVSIPMLTSDQYLELCEIRKALEGLASAVAVESGEPDLLPLLEDILRTYKQTKAKRDVPKTLEMNWRFRFALYRSAGMPRLLEQIANNWLLTGPLFNFLYPVVHAENAYEREYEALLSALKNRNGEAARHAVIQAIDVGTEAVLPFLSTVAPGQGTAPA